MNSENTKGGVWFALGFIGVAAVMLAYEASKQHKRNKKAKAT